MSNSVEDALNRASPERKQAIEDLKSRMSSVENTQPTELKTQLNQNTKENIESTQTGPGNNYLYPNAVDRAQSRPSQEPQKPEPEPEKEH